MTRAAWLEHVGAHAIVDLVRATPGLLLVSLAVRPGRLTNDITSIEASVAADSRDVCRRSLPVFDRYRAQWTLDLSVAFDVPDADPEATLTMAVTLTDGDGAQTVLPCLDRGDDREALALTRIGSIDGLVPWEKPATALGIVS